MNEVEINNDEFILRRIPPNHRKSETRIRGRHFGLRTDETGVSCNREVEISAKNLLARPESKEGSRVARALVGSLTKLGLKIIEVIEEGNPGHCEIRSKTVDLNEIDIRDLVSEQFSFVDDT